MRLLGCSKWPSKRSFRDSSRNVLRHSTRESKVQTPIIIIRKRGIRRVDHQRDERRWRKRWEFEICVCVVEHTYWSSKIETNSSATSRTDVCILQWQRKIEREFIVSIRLLVNVCWCVCVFWYQCVDLAHGWPPPINDRLDPHYENTAAEDNRNRHGTQRAGERGEKRRNEEEVEEGNTNVRHVGTHHHHHRMSNYQARTELRTATNMIEEWSRMWALCCRWSWCCACGFDVCLDMFPQRSWW